MAGELILIVEDTPVNLKLIRLVLAHEGYKTLAAASAEDALELLRSHHPELVLADVQLPGMDGLEMTRRIKRGETTADIGVIALTAGASPADERKTVDAGCDGYLAKPIDARALGVRVREFLESRAAAAGVPAAPAPAPAPIPEAQMRALRQRFLKEGRERLRRFMADPEDQSPADEVAGAAHQWAGAGGLLGYTDISRLAREAEAVLVERPLDHARLRESLANLALAFRNPPPHP
jgi:two-component system cell cycle response regulator DivK